jgi:hypothetical protein
MIRALRARSKPPEAWIVQRMHVFYARSGPSWKEANGDSCSAKLEVVISFVVPAQAGTHSENIKINLTGRSSQDFLFQSAEFSTFAAGF